MTFRPEQKPFAHDDEQYGIEHKERGLRTLPRRNLVNQLIADRKCKRKEEPIRDYSGGQEAKTCKSEGVITWDKTGFFYDKLSELCMESGSK